MSDTNGALCLIYVNDWINESIGAVKKALRIETGQVTGGEAGKIARARHEAPWKDIDAVRHINQDPR